jgi:DNA polymerase-3 subunit delta'
MIAGHKHIIEQLKKLADDNLLSHGYIFIGPNRVGKKTLALGLANYLENKIFDLPQKILVDLLEIDALKISNGESSETSTLDEIRTIKNFLYKKSIKSNYRTVIINNASNLNKFAQNALLKISEEPTENSLIILICEDKESIFQTLYSRFQKIYFSRLKDEELENFLLNFSKNKTKIKELIQISNGLPGLALAILKDENFKKIFEDAKMFLKSKGEAKINFIKNLFSDELKVLPEEFLEILIFLVYNSNKNNLNKNDAKILKKMIEMRRDFNFYNLNPKIHFWSLCKILDKND